MCICMKNLLVTLSQIINKYSIEDSNAKLRLLKSLHSISRFNKKELLNYHDHLLYLLAYPDNEEIYMYTIAELDRLTSILFNYSYNKKLALSGTGLPYTITICSYSYELCKWLSEISGKDVSIDSSGADKTVLRETIRLFFPEPEYWQTTQDELTINHRIRLLKGKKDKSSNFTWLIHQFSNVEQSIVLKEYLFASLKVFVRRKLDVNDSRAYQRLPCSQLYYHHDLIKRCDALSIIELPLPKPDKLNKQQKLNLCNIAKTSLALLYRETDPVTYANPEAVVYFTLERGISIALYGMKTEKRFSMESYVGYMVFKNGMPMAYGGGWMFGSRCKIGVNIYEPYRGGESSYVFSQIIRIYRQYYGMKRFVVKPYQFGKGNPEGIRSGAYWFYYKLGFRSVEKQIACIAQKEWNLIVNEKGYKSSESILKKLTYCNLELVLNEASEPQFDASSISTAITAMINERYDGDRKRATSYSVRYIKNALSLNIKMNEMQILHFKQLALWFALIPNFASWTLADKNKLKELILLKSGKNEREYIFKLKAHKKLWASMKKIVYP